MKTLYFLFACCLIISCKPKVDPTTPAGKLYDEVMAIHDEVMPKVTNEMNTQLKALKKAGKEESGDLSPKITAQIKALREAEDAMMDWMKDFETPNMDNQDEAIAYLSVEKEKISAISDQINSTVVNTEQFLQRLKSN